MKCHTRLEQHALVPFQKYRAVVPFDSSFDQDKRGRLRPKVDIDDETTRVWKLLLENINSEGIDGTDEENTTRWREERRVFSGRAESFIARMRLVQGIVIKLPLYATSLHLTDPTLALLRTLKDISQQVTVDMLFSTNS